VALHDGQGAFSYLDGFYLTRFFVESEFAQRGWSRSVENSGDVEEFSTDRDPSPPVQIYSTEQPLERVEDDGADRLHDRRTSPVETAFATLTGSLTISQIAAPAMVAARRPITATRLTLHLARFMMLKSSTRK
jgi:hypothetical protein